MRFLAHYWWLLVLPVVAYLWVHSMRRTTRRQWIFLLRFAGVMTLLGTALWLVTGDVEHPYLSVRLTGGWPAVAFAIAFGTAALLGAQHLAAKKGPPA